MTTTETNVPTPTRRLFADESAIRAAIFDVIDAGDDKWSWEFFLWGEDAEETENRTKFVDTVIARLATLQSHGLALRIEDYCDRHKRVRMFTSEKCCPDCQREEKR